MCDTLRGEALAVEESLGERLAAYAKTAPRRPDKYWIAFARARSQDPAIAHNGFNLIRMIRQLEGIEMGVKRESKPKAKNVVHPGFVDTAERSKRSGQFDDSADSPGRAGGDEGQRESAYGKILRRNRQSNRRR